MAWARLNLPALDTIGLHDPRCIEFVLVIERRTPSGDQAPPLPLQMWPDTFDRAFAIPAALAVFLTDELHLTTRSDPATQLGIWLPGRMSVTELVDVDGFTVLNGTRTTPWFNGHATTATSGDSSAVTADELTRQLCDAALGVIDYEQILRARPSESDVTTDS